MRALIDGDIIMYSCGFAAQKNIYSVMYGTGDNEVIVDCESKKEANKIAKEMEGEIFTTTRVEPLANALHNVGSMVDRILERVNAHSFTVYISGDNNFRDELVDNYKANRNELHKPYWFNEIKSYLIRNYGAVIVDGQEADDAMSIAQKSCFNSDLLEGETIICSIDKDLDMVPGIHYNWNKDKIYVIGELEGLRNFYKQIITGDSTDNISGLYKLTKQKATKPILHRIDELHEEKDMWNYVRDLYKSGGVDEETIITNARLLWMRREEDEFWSPPSEEESSEEVNGEVQQAEDYSSDKEVQQKESEG